MEHEGSANGGETTQGVTADSRRAFAYLHPGFRATISAQGSALRRSAHLPLPQRLKTLRHFLFLFAHWKSASSLLFAAATSPDRRASEDFFFSSRSFGGIRNGDSIPADTQVSMIISHIFIKRDRCTHSPKRNLCPEELAAPDPEVLRRATQSRCPRNV